MIILSVDYGDKRTGLAVCDKFEMLASPVCVITQRKPELLLEEIAKLAEKYKPELFVVGLPKNMDSSSSILSSPKNSTTRTNTSSAMWLLPKSRQN